MKILSIDIETSSKVDLKKHGVHRYATDPSTLIYLISYTVYEKGKKVTRSILVPELGGGAQDTKSLLDLIKKIKSGDYKLLAHNYMFESILLTHNWHDFCHRFKKGTKFDEETWSSFVCTMFLSNVLGGPSSLKDSSAYFGGLVKKDESRPYMLKASKMIGLEDIPNTLKRIFVKMGDDRYIEWGPEFQKILVEYCNYDTLAALGVFEGAMKRIKELGPMRDKIFSVYRVNEMANNKGIAIDLDKLKKYEKLVEDYEYLSSLVAQKVFKVPKITQRAKILGATRAMGYDITSLSKDSLLEAKLKFGGKFKKIFDIYAKVNKSSILKVTKCVDIMYKGRIYDYLRFCGASATGRWSGRGMQLQNMPRLDVSVAEAEKVFKKVCKDPKEVFKGKNSDTVMGYMRTLLKPDEGFKFYIVDLSQIELRLALYNAGYLDKMEKLHNGVDLYSEQGGKTFGVDPKNLTKKCIERIVGKEAMLSMQFGAGWGSFRSTVLRNSDKLISEDVAKRAVIQYKKEYPKIVDKYQKMYNNRSKHKGTGKDVIVKLRSGRVLNYGPLTEKVMKDKKTGKMYRTLCYKSDGLIKRFKFNTPWQHKIQAEARDIFVIKVDALIKKGYNFTLTVHDEVIIPVIEGMSKERMDKIWNKAGASTIEKYWPGLLLDSESELVSTFR